MAGAWIIISVMSVILAVQNIVPLLILTAVFAAGIPITVIGYRRRSDAKTRGEKPPRALFVTGMVFLLAPPATIIGYVIYATVRVLVSGFTLMDR